MLSSGAQMAANQVERRTWEKVGLSEQHTATSWRLEVWIKRLTQFQEESPSRLVEGRLLHVSS